MSAAERTSEASGENEWVVQANEQMDKRVAQYSKRLFLNHSVQRGFFISFSETFDESVVSSPLQQDPPQQSTPRTSI